MDKLEAMRELLNEINEMDGWQLKLQLILACMTVEEIKDITARIRSLSA